MKTNGFILERLLGVTWSRGGEVFWRMEDAEQEGARLIKRGMAKAIRILPVTVALDPVGELPIPPKCFHGSRPVYDIEDMQRLDVPPN